MPARRPNSPAAADLLVTLSRSENNVWYLKNAGNGNYNVRQQLTIGTFETRHVVLADFDNDTDLNAAVADSAGGSGSVRFLGNNAGASFTLDPWPALTAGINRPHALAACQVVGDPRPDVVVANTDANEVRFYRNDIGGAGDLFVLEQTLAVPVPPGGNPSPRSVACASDGSLIVTGNFFTREVAVFVKSGTSFLDGVRYEVGVQPVSVTVVDIDDDDDQDIIAANNEGNTLSILLNDGVLPRFDEQRLIGSGQRPTFVTHADVDLNGRPDLVNTGWGGQGAGSFVRVTYNTCICSACP